MIGRIRDLTDADRAKLDADLARAEELARQTAELFTDMRRTLAGPPVDMLADPLAAFRLPSGAVSYETTYADEVAVGDWVQRCLGDPDWHLVERVERLTYESRARLIRITYGGLAHDWAPTDAIRRATPPADVIAAQERKAEASR